MPFVNGQFVAEKDEFNYLKKFNEGRANSRLSSAYGSNDPDDFEKAAGYFVAAGRPAVAAQTYVQAKERRDTAEKKQYATDIAGAYARNDFGAAKSAAAAYGDPQGVLAAQEQENAAQKQRRERAFQASVGYYEDLKRIAGMQPGPRNEEYKKLLARARSEAEQSGEDLSLFDRLSPEWDDQAVAQLATALRVTAQKAQSPSEWAAAEREAEQARLKAQAPIELSAGATLVTPDGRPIYTAPRQFAPYQYNQGPPTFVPDGFELEVK